MADHSATKHSYSPMATDMKNFSSLLRTKQRTAFAYGFMFAFVVFSAFFAFSPYSNSSFPLLSNVFTNVSAPHDSQLSSLFSYLSPKNLIVSSSSSPSPAKTDVPALPASERSNSTEIHEVSALPASGRSNITESHEVPAFPGTHGSNNTANHEVPASPAKQVKEGSTENNMVRIARELEKCDFFDGEWIRDDAYPLYKPGACSFIDEQFNCILNGRPDKEFQKYKWKPKGCSLPRLNPDHMLKMLKGKRLAFVGDSLNRNMWESLVCILKQSVKEKANVYEASGRHSFKGEASYSFVFKDYGFSVEFFASPFLVQEWEIPDGNGSKKETLRLDLVGRTSDQYKNADIIVFNTGHWWTHEKTSLGKDYYQEGSHLYSELNVLDAFRKALTTWGKWVDDNVNPAKSFLMFRGYSETHFSGGQWNSGGACDHEVEPIRNATYLREYSSKMVVLEEVLAGMRTPVAYLNITRMTDYRKDGHPSIYRKKNLTEEERRSPLLFQDCSHWCLPGVPDTWNEILYSELLINEYARRPVQAKR